jgi:glutathione peroxidase
MSANLYDIPLQRIDATPVTLASYKDKVLLIVNVASKCGLTPQYAGLEALYREWHGRGLEVLGFPANDFGAQEPGSNEEVAAFCSTTFNVSFPLFSKISVVGVDQHPLYHALTHAQPQAVGEDPFREAMRGYGIESNAAPDVQWNFEKFLVGRDGAVIGRFAPDITADDPRLVEAIEAALN